MHIFLSFVVGLGLCFAAEAKLLTERLTLQGDNVRIEGVRYKNAKGELNTGPWVLLPHGLHSNFHEFRHVAEILTEAGYDCYAFNFRGHGNGPERSTVLNYKEGDYELEPMAKTDLPLMIAKIQELNKGRGHVIGHSMGGMVLRAAIALGLLDQSILDSVVLLGSPPHFRTKSALNDWFGPVLERALFRGKGNDEVGMPTHWLGETMFDFFTLMSPLYSWFKDSTTRAIPKDILRSFARFQREYPYEHVTLEVPALYIMGEKDILVKDSDIEETAKAQSKQAGYWLMKLKGVGHLSLVAPLVATEYSKTLLSFLKNPEGIGPKNETRIDFRPVYGCQGLLVAP